MPDNVSPVQRTWVISWTISKQELDYVVKQAECFVPWLQHQNNMQLVLHNGNEVDQGWYEPPRVHKQVVKPGFVRKW